MKIKISICLIVLMLVFKVEALTLTSPSYPVGSVIPNDFTFSAGSQCSGDNVSPQLLWSDVPAGTQSFAMVFIDENFNFLHWKLYNIDASVTHLPENNPNNVGTEGQTNFGINGYGGPCPPSSTPGNYRMTVYALNTVFTNEPSVSAIQAAAIESAQWLAFRNITDDQERYEYSARYRLTFQAEWSSASHPIDFPIGAHFSPLVGNTHGLSGYIWRDADIASDGIEEMAETGASSLLQAEINVGINSAGSESRIVGAGSDATDTIQLEFDISESHPLFSMVTMIAPSPDWFIGVHDLDLRENGLWKNTFTIDLFPYDAGTDEGTSFTDPNADTFPRALIERIVTTPFPNGVRLGRFVFDLLSTDGEATPDAIFANGFE